MVIYFTGCGRRHKQIQITLSSFALQVVEGCLILEATKKSIVIYQSLMESDE